MNSDEFITKMKNLGNEFDYMYTRDQKINFIREYLDNIRCKNNICKNIICKNNICNNHKSYYTKIYNCLSKYLISNIATKCIDMIF